MVYNSRNKSKQAFDAHYKIVMLTLLTYFFSGFVSKSKQVKKSRLLFYSRLQTFFPFCKRFKICFHKNAFANGYIFLT